MAIEIERRFFVPMELALEKAQGRAEHKIHQGYLSLDREVTIRIRLINDEKAWLTIKGPKVSAGGPEYEYEVPYQDGVELMGMTKSSVKKTRYEIPFDNHVIELDIYDSEKHGNLAIAEVEFSDLEEFFTFPDWFGVEITEMPRYSNAIISVQKVEQSEIDYLSKSSH